MWSGTDRAVAPATGRDAAAGSRGADAREHRVRKVLYLLGYLTDGDIEWMISHGDRRRLAAGTVLIREGEPIDALYILLDGSLTVSFSALTGTETVRLSSGEVVGEMSFIENRAPSATVTVAENAVVLAIPRKALLAKLQGDPAFAACFYRSLALFLSHRLRETVGRLGYGKSGPPKELLESQDELDTAVLNSIHLAGARFDRVLQRLLAC
ncbi:MAG: cyclic nucleotide-binding domain-containing protein [Candidatus Riflebacteria bacterium]|nr:cyclic nucleotide-binding domain-containing protein [Candidatus Riflebacteria bacterium]